jgi:hypothetical protein
MTFDYPIWKDIGVKLRDVDYPKRYVTPENYKKANPLENLVVPPDIEKFFGTKTCNLFIASRPYGWSKGSGNWTESWPPEGFDESVARHKQTYKQFARYETHIWTDFYLVSIVEGFNPDTRLREMMEAVEGHLEAVCTELADYGFTYEGRIEDAIESNFFASIIDAFWKKPSQS